MEIDNVYGPLFESGQSSGTDGGMGLLGVFLLVGVGLAAIAIIDALGNEAEDDNDGDGPTTLFGGNDEPIAGTAGDDVIEGDIINDTLRGGAGDDVIYGRMGEDSLAGDQGNDTLYGGPGNDQVGRIDSFQEDQDNLFQMDGDDVLYGGDSADQVFDQRGANTLYGDRGNDTLNATDRFETDTSVIEGISNFARTPDVLYGGDGNDRLFVDDGDTVFGGFGFDTIRIEPFHNSIRDNEEAPVVIGDFEVGRDRLEIWDQLGNLGSDGVYSVTPAIAEEGLWVVLGDTRVALILGLGTAPSALDSAEIQVVYPFSP